MDAYRDAPSEGPAPDGRGDFDFFIGDWIVSAKRLRHGTWELVTGTTRVIRILQGAGNVDEDEFRLADQVYVGGMLRLFDTEANVWLTYGLNRNRGSLQPPLSGRFHADVACSMARTSGRGARSLCGTPISTQEAARRRVGGNRRSPRTVATTGSSIGSSTSSGAIGHLTNWEGLQVSGQFLCPNLRLPPTGRRRVGDLSDARVLTMRTRATASGRIVRRSRCP